MGHVPIARIVDILGNEIWYDLRCTVRSKIPLGLEVRDDAFFFFL